MFDLYYVTWDGSFKWLVDSFNNFDEADNARLVHESRMNIYEREDGYYLVMEA